jgi:hypothetical protein
MGRMCNHEMGVFLKGSMAERMAGRFRFFRMLTVIVDGVISTSPLLYKNFSNSDSAVLWV